MKNVFSHPKKILRSATLLISALVLTATPSVGAQQQEGMSALDLYSINNNTAHYDPTPRCNTNVTVNPVNLPLSGDNVKDTFLYFIGKGLTAAQTAGILGNLREESGVNPAIHQNGRQLGAYPVHTVGFGIAQWTFKERQQPLVDLAKSRNVLPNTLRVQQDFMWQELEGKYLRTLEALRKDTTPEAASRTFHKGYEGSADNEAQLRERDASARKTFAQYGNLAPGSTPIVDAAAQSKCPAVDLGGAPVNADGYVFPLAPRTKKNYGSVPCTKPFRNGEYTAGGIYTNKYGVKAAVATCHHDATPAADLMDGNGGSPVYAITKGKVVSVDTCYSMSGPCVEGCHSLQFQADNGVDRFIYWYGHIMGAGHNPINQTIEAGTQLGKTATRPGFDSRCWGGGPHLHIDRGCVNPKNGQPQRGGSKNCREARFPELLNKIWEGLPTTSGGPNKAL